MYSIDVTTRRPPVCLSTFLNDFPEAMMQNVFVNIGPFQWGYSGKFVLQKRLLRFFSKSLNLIDCMGDKKGKVGKKMFKRISSQKSLGGRS